MKVPIVAIGLFAFVFGFAAATACADEVYLKNGNQLSGKLVSVVDGKLELETDYAGKLTIDWGQVERISSDQSLTVVLNDGSTLTGTMRPSTASGRMELSTPSIAESTVVEFVNVTALNPPVEPAIKLSG